MLERLAQRARNELFQRAPPSTEIALRKAIQPIAKEPYKRDDILQKRPIILRRLLVVASPSRTDGSSQDETLPIAFVVSCLESQKSIDYLVH